MVLGKVQGYALSQLEEETNAMPSGKPPPIRARPLVDSSSRKNAAEQARKVQLARNQAQLGVLPDLKNLKAVDDREGLPELFNALEIIWARKAVWGVFDRSAASKYRRLPAKFVGRDMWKLRQIEIVASRAKSAGRLKMRDGEYEEFVDAVAHQYISTEAAKKEKAKLEKADAYKMLSTAAREAKDIDPAEISGIFRKVKCAAVNTGLVDALEFADCLVVRELREFSIPSMALDVLKDCKLDPHRTIRMVVATANHCPFERTEKIFQNSTRLIKEYGNKNVRQESKSVVGFRMILSGSAVITKNILAASAGGGELILPGLLFSGATALPLIKLGTDDVQGA